MMYKALKILLNNVSFLTPLLMKSLTFSQNYYLKMQVIRDYNHIIRLIKQLAVLRKLLQQVVVKNN
jgi:hypothetical protein